MINFIDDADYKPTIQVYMGKGLSPKTVWTCPFHKTWKNMLYRVYVQGLKPTSCYYGCSVADEWFTFSKFKAWMETQDWEGKQLDKDLMVWGNKVYSPETCIFVSQDLNNNLKYTTMPRKYPRGISKRCQRYAASISISNKMEWLGTFDSVQQAYEVVQNRRVELVEDLLDSEGADEFLRKIVWTRCKILEELLDLPYLPD